jgi:glycerol uptake facilitator-like aquaporin
MSPIRPLAAEFIGTLLLLATVVGSGVMAERLAMGNDAVALLGNTAATGAVLYVLITLLGPISGAHFNPVVSFMLGSRKQLPGYVAAQLAGALCGVWLVHLMFDMTVLQWGVKPRAGLGIWVSEAVATFGLLLTILLGLRHKPESVPALVALWIVGGYWFTASTSFANPAVTIARALTDSFAGIRPLDVPGFILAQIAGALLAGAVARWFMQPQLKPAC